MRTRTAMIGVLMLGLVGITAIWGCLVNPQQKGAREASGKHSNDTHDATVDEREYEVWIIGRPPVSGGGLIAPGDAPPPAASDPGAGLKAKLADRNETIPLPLKHTDVKAQISLHVASVQGC